MKYLNMVISLDNNPTFTLPDGYHFVNITEENAQLWELVMDQTYDGYEFLPGTFRYVMAANHYYDENRVFALINREGNPVAVASAWSCGEKWDIEDMGEVTHVCVDSKFQGNRYGRFVVYNALQELKRRNYKTAHLGVRCDNYSAIKTYINCGFIPFIEEIEEYNIWIENYRYLSIKLPECGFKKPDNYIINSKLTYVTTEYTHPPRPWPNQIKQFAQALEKGKTYVFGCWIRYNMYKVDPSVYISLREMILTSKYTAEIVKCILENKVRNIYVNNPVSPTSLLLEHINGACYFLGTKYNEQFTEGIQHYLQREYVPLVENEGKNFRLIKDGCYDQINLYE
ncbi:MAG: Acetyltransferase family [Herbinix sp.]|jgi:ribosomal protein S18 acetylase RimI-like enzyme|nr:Acetyltransferase family [Herbinix sp.]